ncbi:MAG: phosphotransferase [Erysipelotrichaceae bacterium]|nr:phosphotransferase [Erysipelotrichaceae bacterium]
MNREVKTQRKNKSVYIEGDRCYKVFAPGYNKADILNEALIQSRVEETGLEIPCLLAVTMIDNRWALLTEYIEGKTMEELMDENPDKEDEYLKQFVATQIRVQSKRCPLLNKHRDKMNRKISETDLSATMRYSLHSRIEAMPRHNSLCHGDFNPTNVVVSDKDGKAYIVDWSHATQGNEEADAARTYMMFLVEGKNKRANKYMKYFCEANGCKPKEVLQWLPILAASQSVKGIKNQSEFLRSLIFMDEKELEQLYEEF